MYKVKVYVTLRESVLDPQGTAVKEHFIVFHSQKYKMFELEVHGINN